MAQTCYSGCVKYLILAIALVVLYIVVSRRRPFVMSTEISAETLSQPLWVGMAGVAGTADQTFTSEGTVSVNGEIWKATSRRGIIHKGAKVRVVAIKPGLVLEVEADESAST